MIPASAMETIKHLFAAGFTALVFLFMFMSARCFDKYCNLSKVNVENRIFAGMIFWGISGIVAALGVIAVNLLLKM